MSIETTSSAISAPRLMISPRVNGGVGRLILQIWYFRSCFARFQNLYCGCHEKDGPCNICPVATCSVMMVGTLRSPALLISNSVAFPKMSVLILS